jgi:hypothetical protein
MRLKKVGDLDRENFLFYGNGLLNALKNVAVVNVKGGRWSWGLRLVGENGYFVCVGGDGGE